MIFIWQHLSRLVQQFVQHYASSRTVEQHLGATLILKAFESCSVCLESEKGIKWNRIDLRIVTYLYSCLSSLFLPFWKTLFSFQWYQKVPHSKTRMELYMKTFRGSQNREIFQIMLASKFFETFIVLLRTKNYCLAMSHLSSIYGLHVNTTIKILLQTEDKNVACKTFSLNQSLRRMKD